MAQEFTLEDFNAALTQLPEHGGYAALAGALGETYPDARFSPVGNNQGIRELQLTQGNGFLLLTPLTLILICLLPTKQCILL